MAACSNQYEYPLNEEVTMAYKMNDGPIYKRPGQLGKNTEYARGTYKPIGV